MRRCTLLAGLVLLAVTTSLTAQTTTATLVGRAVANGNPLPGVLVTISSPALIGSRTVVTASDGQYVVPALPPGEYVVRFEMEGLEPVAQRATLHLSQLSRVDVAMKPAALQSEIVVRPGSSTALETPQVSTNLTGETMELLPTSRGILDAVRLAPGVLQTGFQNLVSINGGDVYDNLYMVNGVTVQSRFANQPLNLFIEDAIQETTILSSGVSAEYGRFTGGVVNVITKSGGNEMSGSLRDTLGNDSWIARTPYPGEIDHLDEVSHEMQGTLGGRVLRDRLWFFLSGRYYDRNFNRATLYTLNPYIYNSHEERIEAKLTGSIRSNHSVVASYLKVDAVQQNASAAIDLRSLSTAISPNSLFSTHYTGVFGNNLVVEVQYSRKTELARWEGGGDTTEIGGLPIYDAYTGGQFWASVLCGACGRSYGNAKDAVVKGSWFAPSARLGTHELAFGVDDYHDLMQGQIRAGTSDIDLYAPILVDGNKPIMQLLPDETFMEWWVYPPTREGDFNARAAYVNDRISFGTRLSTSIGFRYDKNHAENSDGTVVMNDARLSPRIGLVYDLFGNARDRVSASFSRYTAKPQEAAASGAEQATNPAIYFWIYDGAPVNEDGTLSTEQVIQQFFNWFNARGGKSNTSDAFIANAGIFEIDGTLATPYSDEISLGYARRISQNGWAQITLVDRHWSSFFTYGTILGSAPGVRPDGTRYDRLFLTSGEDDGLERKYRSAQLQGTYRRGRFSAAGNYTYATLRGNVEVAGSSGAPNPQRSPTRYYPEFNSFEMNSPVGYLNGDVRHTANGWLIYRLPGERHRFTLSVLERYHTGRPYNMSGQIELTGSATNPGYVSRQFYGNYYFKPRGSLRLEDVHSTSLGLQYSIQLGAVEILAHGNIINAFNEQAIENTAGIPTQVRTNQTDRNLALFNPRTKVPIECPPGVATSSAQCKGIANYQLAPGFGVPRSNIAYQQPRTYTLSFAARF
jgi:hypothetical protein